MLIYTGANNQGSKVRAGIDQSQAMRENWILEQRPSSPPPPFTPPPFTPQHMSQTTYTPFPPSTYPPPPPGSPPPPAAQPPPPPGKYQNSCNETSYRSKYIITWQKRQM